MAVKQLVDVDLIVVVDTGDDMMTGETIYKNRYISNVNTNVTTDQAFACILSLMGLQKHAVYTIHQREKHDLTAA